VLGGGVHRRESPLNKIDIAAPAQRDAENPIGSARLVRCRDRRVSARAGQAWAIAINDAGTPRREAPGSRTADCPLGAKPRLYGGREASSKSLVRMC
jgi:hypothetical protein